MKQPRPALNPSGRRCVVVGQFEIEDYRMRLEYRETGPSSDGTPRKAYIVDRDDGDRIISCEVEGLGRDDTFGKVTTRVQNRLKKMLREMNTG